VAITRSQVATGKIKSSLGCGLRTALYRTTDGFVTDVKVFGERLNSLVGLAFAVLVLNRYEYIAYALAGLPRCATFTLSSELPFIDHLQQLAEHCAAKWAIP